MPNDQQRNETPEDPLPDAIDHAAAIDDFFGGFADRLPHDPVEHRADDRPLPGSLDLLLLLRQVGASGVATRAIQPESIGRYRILGQAGRGGFSVVWEAFDPLLRRRVAVKVCTPDALVSPAVRRRFRREAELASRLVHPHIVTIYEVGEDDGLEFITSEYCEAGSMAEWLARHPGPVPPAVTARIGRAVALAAAHAHESGIIHRDIKPANVMLVPIDSHDASACVIPPEPVGDRGMTVKLGDFGLGRLSDPGDGEDPLTQLTTDGARLGTPAWMAPEQIDRSFGVVGPATDIHAIGLLIDRMLTGRPLRGGKTDVENYREVLLDEPASADRVAEGVPADLAAVCLKCLEKKPGDRYVSAASLADDLGRWLAGLPTRVRPLTAIERLGRGIARRRLVVTLVAAAIMTTGIAGWVAVDRSRERGRSAAHRETIRRQEAAAELCRGFDCLRAANVAGGLEQIDKTRTIDLELADSLAARWLRRRLHGEREILVRPRAAVGGSQARTDLHCLAISAEGHVAVVGGADGILRVLRTEDGRTTVTEVPAHDEVNDVCLSSDGRLMASVGQDGCLRWWNVDAADAPAGEVPTVGCALYAVAFGPDDASLFYGGEDRVLRRIPTSGDEQPTAVYRFADSAGDSPEIEAIKGSGRVIFLVCGGALAAVDSRDGRLLWSWDHQEGEELRAVFHALTVSADGMLLAAGGSDRVVRVWEALSGRLLQTMPAHPGWIQACFFSPDGVLLATACRDGVIRVFDATTGKAAGKLVGHAGRVWDVGFEPGGTLLSAGADGTVRRWERVGAPSPSGARSLPVSGQSIKMVRDATLTAGSSSGRIVAVPLNSAPLLIDVLSGATTEVSAVGSARLHGAAVDRPRRRIAFGFAGGSSKQTPIVVEIDGDVTSLQVTAPPSAVGSIGPYICWTPDGRLAATSRDGRLVLWTPGLDEVNTLGNGLSVFRLEAAPTGIPRVAIASRPATVCRIDDGDQAPIPMRIDDLGDQVSSLAWSPDGLRLVCGCRSGAVHVLDAQTGRHLSVLAPHERQIADIAFSPDGRVILTADAECLRISDAATLASFDELRPGWQIESMCLVADGRFIAVGGRDMAADSSEQARLAVLDLSPR